MGLETIVFDLPSSVLTTIYTFQMLRTSSLGSSYFKKSPQKRTRRLTASLRSCIFSRLFSTVPGSNCMSTRSECPPPYVLGAKILVSRVSEYSINFTSELTSFLSCKELAPFTMMHLITNNQLFSLLPNIRNWSVHCESGLVWKVQVNTPCVSGSGSGQCWSMETLQN